jgi:hypothetical protein
MGGADENAIENDSMLLGTLQDEVMVWHALRDLVLVQRDRSLANGSGGHRRALQADVRGNNTFMAGGVDCCDAEDVVIDLQAGQHDTRDVAHQQIVLPVGPPGIPPEDAVRDGAG